MRYDPNTIEPKWQAAWEEREAFRTPADPAELARKPKYYILDMFPYPSGAGLHVGHPEGYTATDVLARLRRMQGYNVLHPMGWDAFGLPAERAAMRENIHPAVITRRNVDNFRRQIKRLGFSYDWSREISTSSPDYYRWTQWIFLKLFERGLAYVAEMPVNWCPALGTVLANEEVKDGRYVETGDPVERRSMQQWMLRITAYAERLLARPRRPRLAGRRQGHAAQLDRQIDRRRRHLPRSPAASRLLRRSSPPGPTPSSARPTACWRRSTRWGCGSRRPTSRAAVRAYFAEAGREGLGARPQQRRQRRRPASSPAPTR